MKNYRWVFSTNLNLEINVPSYFFVKKIFNGEPRLSKDKTFKLILKYFKNCYEAQEALKIWQINGWTNLRYVCFKREPFYYLNEMPINQIKE